MSKIIKYMFLLPVLVITMSGCLKENISSTAETVGISKIIFFPTIETKGEKLMIINVGDPFTDEGATAILNEEEIEYTTEGTVDPATPGVYVINYGAANAEGYAVSDFRTVVVIDEADVAANDFSGTYARYVSGSPNGQTSTWTKTGTGVYSIENPGGATGLTVVGVNYKGKTVVVPQQSTNVGTFRSTEAEYNTATSTYVWAIVNGGYGPADRTFIKQ